MVLAWAVSFSVAFAEEIQVTFSDEDVVYVEEVSGLSLRGAIVGHRLDEIVVNRDGSMVAKG